MSSGATIDGSPPTQSNVQRDETRFDQASKKGVTTMKKHWVYMLATVSLSGSQL